VGKIVAIAPEGTRSRNGKLQKALPGIVLLAARSGAPILPVVYYGHESFQKNIKKLKRTPMHVVVGESFKLNIKGIALSREVRQQVVNEIMYQLAALLPTEYHGFYSDFSRATEEYLVFDVGIESNLVKAKGRLVANIS